MHPEHLRIEELHFGTVITGEFRRLPPFSKAEHAPLNVGGRRYGGQRGRIPFRVRQRM